MMQRLRDLPDPLEPDNAAARELLRHIEPLPVSAAQSERVLAAVHSRAAAAAAPTMSALGKAAVFSLVVGAVLALTVTYYLARRPEPMGAPPPVQTVPARAPDVARGAVSAPVFVPAASPPPAPEIELPKPAALAKSRRIERAPSPIVAPSSEPPALPLTAAPAPTPTPASDTASKAAEVPKVEAPPSPSEVPEEADPAEAALVLSAMQALRQQHQPAQALALLTEYQHRFPAGALQEEALALRLESLVALSEHRAVEVAREYLARYPRGRFKSFASAILARDRDARSRKEAP